LRAQREGLTRAIDKHKERSFMHHGRDQIPNTNPDYIPKKEPRPGSDKLASAARSKEPGATGKFPEGKLNESDKGEIRIGVDVVTRKVVINFGQQPITWIGLNLFQARDLAESLISTVNEIEKGEI
jgi:hypothetical protein